MSDTENQTAIEAGSVEATAPQGNGENPSAESATTDAGSSTTEGSSVDAGATTGDASGESSAEAAGADSTSDTAPGVEGGGETVAQDADTDGQPG
jgi:hypothetical protein